MTIPLVPTMQVLAALNCQGADIAEQERLDAQCEGDLSLHTFMAQGLIRKVWKPFKQILRMYPEAAP
jgi:hypothetical protein